MAAMTLEPRDPDMAHFIDSYKFERQMEERRNKFGGGTSLPLNSDGYEDRQRFLREERHKDWVEQQEKDLSYKHTVNPYPHPKLTRGPQNRTNYDIEIQRMTDRYHNKYDDVLVKGDEQDPVYYRLGTPEYGLPIGNYEKHRHQMNLERQRDYNNMMKKQRKMEQERFEQRRRNRQPPAPPQGNQIDYNEAQELAKAEERRAYQDYQGKFSNPVEGRLHVKAPVSYEENKKVLAEERRQDYAQYQEKKAKEERYRALRGRPVTPPGGLNIGQYDRQVKESKAQKTKEYKDMLDQQAAERLKYRYLERLAETSPAYTKYRDEERPLVGSPRDINPALYEKESKNVYDKDLKNKPTPGKSVSPSLPAVKSPVEDPNVKAFLEIERQKQQEKKQYAEELLKQQKEQMFLKAQRDTEMSVLDRQRPPDSQYLATKPPAGPGYTKPRDEPSHQTQGYWNEGRRAPSPQSLASEAQRRQRDDGVPLAFQTNTFSRPRSRGQEQEQGYVPSLSDAPVRRQPYDEMSGRSPRELMPLRTPPRRTPPPRTPPRRRDYNEQSEKSRINPRSPRRRSPPPRTPPQRETDKSDVNSKYSSDLDFSPRRMKALELEESQYDRMRKAANLARKEDYNRYVKEKEEERRRHLSNKPAGKPAEVVKGPYYSSDNYESYQTELRRKQIDDYKDYLKKNYQAPLGAQGLPLEQARYEPKRLAMEAERNAEYNDHLQKSPRDHEKVKGPQGSTDKSPQGLPLYPKQAVEKAKLLEKQRNREYNEFLRQEQETQQVNRYQDVPNPFLPPPAHNPHLPEPYQTNPHIYQQSMKAPYPKANSAPGQLSLPVGQYDDVRPFLVKQRNRDYNNYKEQLPPPRPPRVTPEATAVAVSLPIGEIEEKRPFIEKQQVDEFNKLLAAEKLSKKSPREKAHTPPYLQGLPIGQHHYEPLYRAMEYQRNKEYNEFMNKRFGQKKARSEPDRVNKTSFYLGNDFIHAEKRRFLDAERQKEYNDFLKQQPPPLSKDIAIPTDIDSGLPIGQQHHEAWRRFLRDQRNREYNQLVEKTSHVSKNRSWKESENGLLLPEDHSVEYRRRELQAQRKKEYNEHLAQSKGPPNHYWPEPEPGQGALWHKKGEYDGIKQMYQEERKKEFIDKLEQKRQPDKFESPRAQTQPNPIRYSSFNPMVDSMGRYEELRHKLRDIRRKEFLDFMDKHRLEDRRHGNQPPELAKDENPLVFSMGRYELEQMKKVREEAHRDLAKFYEEQQKNMSPRRYEVEIPRLARAEDPIVNHLGSYDKEKEKFILQRHKDFREFSQKYKEQHHSPWNNFVYPLNAYLEHPVVEKMGHEMEEKRRVLRDERKRDYERYLSEQRMTEVPRRDGYGNNVAGPYDGMFHGLGEHGNQKDVLNQQRRQEYNDKLDQQYSQRERPTGRPSWAKDPMTDKQDHGDRGRTPLRSPVKPDHYEQMLHEKRREEAQRRRYDDPEYQEKLARMDSRERGPARDQPRYGY